MNKTDFDIIRKGITNWNLYRNTTILVTGSTGRLGRYIVETFVDVDLTYNLNLRLICIARSKDKAISIFGAL